MDIQCDRCGSNTKEKIITSKKPETRGNQYTVMECLGSCRAGKYPYTFFPPKEPPPEKQQSNGGGQAIVYLRAMDISLKNILEILQKKTGSVPVQETELQPDKDTIF